MGSWSRRSTRWRRSTTASSSWSALSSASSRSCADQDEIDYFWEKLSQGGEEGQCGWLKDRFGLSWQVVPSGMDEVFSDPDPKRAERAMQAMLKMSKLDLAALRRAADGDGAG